MKWLLVLFLFSCSFPAFGIFNLKTGQEQEPKNLSSKKWIMLAQGCHSCVDLLLKLKTFCKGKDSEGKAPSHDKIGFFVSGSERTTMLTKLKDFTEKYEIYGASAGELYQHYQVMNSPSLKSGKTLLSGKEAILEFLKKDKNFCSNKEKQTV